MRIATHLGIREYLVMLTNVELCLGARIVRIATHPGYQRMGYGTRALKLLQKYYQVFSLLSYIQTCLDCK